MQLFDFEITNNFNSLRFSEFKNHRFQIFEKNLNKRIINFEYFINIKELIVVTKESIVTKANFDHYPTNFSFQNQNL
jgi:hypothetical protein